MSSNTWLGRATGLHNEATLHISQGIGTGNTPEGVNETVPHTSTASRPATIPEKDGAVVDPDFSDLRRAQPFRLVDDRPIKTQFIWNAVLQICGLIAAFLFGVFSVLGYLATHEGNTITSLGNEESFTANQLALIAFCDGGAGASNVPVCSRVQSLAAANLAKVATSLFSLTPIEVTTTRSISTYTSVVTVTPVTTGTPTPTSTQSGLSTSDKVAIGVSIPAALIAVCGVTLAVYTYRAKSRRRDWQE